MRHILSITDFFSFFCYKERLKYEDSYDGHFLFGRFFNFGEIDLMQYVKVFVFVMFFFSLFSHSAHAIEKHCKSLYKQQQYLQAAQCFKKLLIVVDTKPALKSLAGLLKDRYLRHAAICYVRLAQLEKNIEKSSYYKELAIKLLLRSFKKGYCEASQRCRSNQVFSDQLRKEISYSTLVIITGNKKASIQVKGFKVQQTQTHTFNQKLRPGHYQIIIKFPQKSSVRQITLEPNRIMTLNVTPTKIIIKQKYIYIAKKIPPLVLTSYIVGGVVAVGGLVLMIYSGMEQGRLNDIRNDPKKARTMTDNEYNQAFDTAQSYMVIGGITLGAGIAISAIGMTVHLVTHSQKPTKTVKMLSSFLKTPTRKFRHVQQFIPPINRTLEKNFCLTWQ